MTFYIQKKGNQDSSEAGLISQGFTAQWQYCCMATPAGL